MQQVTIAYYVVVAKKKEAFSYKYLYKDHSSRIMMTNFIVH